MFSSSVRNMDPASPNETEAAVKRYMQAVKQELHCSKAQKALFLRQMEDRLERESHTRDTVNDIIKNIRDR